MKYFILFAITIIIGCYGRKPEKTGLEGKPIPPFKLQLIDNVSYFDSKDIPIDKPVVLFYYAPRCPYCRNQINEIIEDMELLKVIQFYLVSSSSIPEIKKFYNQNKLSQYPNIVTGKDFKNVLEEYYEIKGVPFMAIYRKDKKMNKAFYGKIYSKQIRAAALD